MSEVTSTEPQIPTAPVGPLPGQTIVPTPAAASLPPPAVIPSVPLAQSTSPTGADYQPSSPLPPQEAITPINPAPTVIPEITQTLPAVTGAETSDGSPQYAEGSFYNEPEDDAITPINDIIRWTASEYVSHDKSAGWYLTVGIVALIVAVMVFILTKDKISTGVVLIAASCLAFYARRKPRQLQYEIDGQGISIAGKQFSYDRFRSFAIVQEGAFDSIELHPLQRFAPLITIYFSPDDEPRIVETLASILPMDDKNPNLFDNMVRKIRF